LLGIETNFSTFPQKELQRLKYPKFFIREVEDTYTRRLNQTFGFKTTKLTRPLVLADLVQIMRENISLINDRTTLNEALTFVKNSEGRMEAIEGKHDDTIMALAIAYYIRIQQRTKPSDEIGSKEKDFISANFSTKKEGKGGYINWRED
jgi:phage terminase large subunit